MDQRTTMRRPFKGSCHCGEIRYIAFLMMPHVDKSATGQRIYRCNCTPCHKAGFFHIRLQFAPDDFILLSPSNPFASLGDYTCNDKTIHWFFCKTCGDRCFLFAGEGENVEMDLSKLGIEDGPGESLGSQSVWRPKAEGWVESKGQGKYLSVNGYTVDAAQDGFDLRTLTEEKAVAYLDYLELSEGKEQPRWDRPHAGGGY